MIFVFTRYGDMLIIILIQLPRPVFDQAVSWATKPGRANFWKIPHEQRDSAFGSAEEYVLRVNPQTNVFQKFPSNEEYISPYRRDGSSMLINCGGEGMKVGSASYDRRA